MARPTVRGLLNARAGGLWVERTWDEAGVAPPATAYHRHVRCEHVVSCGLTWG